MFVTQKWFKRTRYCSGFKCRDYSLNYQKNKNVTSIRVKAEFTDPSFQMGLTQDYLLNYKKLHEYINQAKEGSDQTIEGESVVESADS